MRRRAENTIEFSLVLILVGIVCLFSFIRLGNTTQNLISNLASQNNTNNTKAPAVTSAEAQAIETSGAAAFIANAKTPEEAFVNLSNLISMFPSGASYSDIMALLNSVPDYKKPEGLTDKLGGIPPCSYCYYDDYTVGSVDADGKLISVQRVNPTLGDQGGTYYIDPVNISYEPYFSTNDPVPAISYSINRGYGSSSHETYISYYVPGSSTSIPSIRLPNTLTIEQQQSISMKVIALVLSKKQAFSELKEG